MGSYEIFAKNCETNTQTIVKIKTPSPLTSSISSGGSSSSSSLSTGINELTFTKLIHRVGNCNDVSSGEEPEDEELSEDIESTGTLKSVQSWENEGNILKSSIQSSSSSLNRRIRDSPLPSKALKVPDHVNSLDRRIRKERNIYLLLRNLKERIEEKDKAEASSVVCSDSTSNLLSESFSRPRIKDVGAPKITKMCSSAPETMRLEKQTYEQRLHDFTKDIRKPMIRNFNECRPPKYLQPLRTQSREILRSNAPPLCLTDKKIVELLRRGSMSAREEYLKKSSNIPRKVAGFRQPTGMIIENLSSGSGEDNCTSEWIIRNYSGSNVTKFENKANAAVNSNTGIEKFLGDGMSLFPKEIQCQEENEAFDPSQSTRNDKSFQKSLNAGTTELVEEIEVSDHSHSLSVTSMHKSLRSSMAELRSVLNNIDMKSRDTRPLDVPNLEIKSQEYSQSTSIASREDTTKRTLDMNALIRALSDVSLKQQQLVDRKIQSVCNSVVSESAEPMSSRYTSIANGSRQSIISMDNIERQEKNSKYSLTQNSSRGSMDTTIKWNERNINNRSKIPIVVDETHDNAISKINYVDSRNNSEKKIGVDESVGREQERNSKIISCKNSSTRNNSKCQSGNSMHSEQRSINPIKLYSPPMKRNRQSKSPKTSRTNASSSQEKSSRLPNSLRTSKCLLENSRKWGKKNKKYNNGPARVLSEPGSSKNCKKNLRNHLSSRVTYCTRDIFPGILKDHSLSSDDKYKYLRCGSQIPCVRSSSSISSSEVEESEVQQVMVKSSASNCPTSDELKIKGKFKIYEDTDEPPPRQQTFPTDKLNITAKKSSACTSKPSREIHKIKLKSPRANAQTERKDSKLNYFPEDSIQQNDRRENIVLRESVEPRNLFWADCSSELNRAMGSSFEFNETIATGVDSDLISQRTTVKIKKSSTSSCRSSSKKPSIESSNVSGSSGSPRYRYDENARAVSRNLAAGTIENFMADPKRKSKEENICSVTSIVKRLSYTEMKENPIENETSRKRSFQELPEALSAEEFMEYSGLNSSQTNLAITGRSDGAVHLFRKAFDRATSRVKMASSLSKLTRSPEDLRRECSNLTAEHKSQDDFNFTISESISGDSSSKFKAEQAIQMASDSNIVEPSETTYGLTAHPSLLRLANAGVEPTTAEIIQTALHDPDIQYPSQKVPRIHRFLGFSWRRSRNKNDKREIKTTKILYRNNKCRGGSADGSSGSTNVSVEKPGRQFNRDGLWVDGFRDEANPEAGKPKHNSFAMTEDVAEKKQQYEMDRFSISLANPESSYPRQFIRQAFDTYTPMNSLMLDEDPDIDVDPGCLCSRFCLFLIGGSVNTRYRSSFPLRNRRSRIRRTF